MVSEKILRKYAEIAVKMGCNVQKGQMLVINADVRDYEFVHLCVEEGYKAGAGAKQIRMLLVHPSAVITPEKYAFAQLDAPSALTFGKYFYFEESYDDVFLLNKRKNAVQFNHEP